MNEEKIIKGKYKLAVKRALAGELSGLDVMSIVRFQCKELGEIDEIGIRMLVAYQMSFN